MYADISKFQNILVERGHIYKGTYKGWYSVSDEAFVGADDVKDITTLDGKTIKVLSQTMY